MVPISPAARIVPKSPAYRIRVGNPGSLPGRRMNRSRCTGTGDLHFGSGMDAALMASITIKNLPPALHERLKEAARRNHRSLRSEIIACLERHVGRLPRRRTELPAEAAALRERLPRIDHGLVDEYKRAGRSSAASTSFNRATRISGSMGDSAKPQVR